MDDAARRAELDAEMEALARVQRVYDAQMDRLRARTLGLFCTVRLTIDTLMI